jgi:hypothetical protein
VGLTTLGNEHFATGALIRPNATLPGVGHVDPCPFEQ